jgi:hypothetical protein
VLFRLPGINSILIMQDPLFCVWGSLLSGLLKVSLGSMKGGSRCQGRAAAVGLVKGPSPERPVTTGTRREPPFERPWVNESKRPETDPQPSPWEPLFMPLNGHCRREGDGGVGVETRRSRSAASAKPRCRLSLTQSPWRRRNSWPLDDERELHRLKPPTPSVRPSIS